MKDLVGSYYAKFTKSLRYLEYSFLRTQAMPTDPRVLTDPELEAWDSFSSRFARSSDLFLSKYLRAYVKNDDPAFDGGFRDYFLRGEKLGIISSLAEWLEIRELRNVVVHDYSDSDLEQIFLKFRKYTPMILALASQIPSHAPN